ncbi:hypothetical protein GCM10010149_73970 [Nonomuraea roseoviolacea subsp. roseoviolacea]|uniref:hypothetical protein n=1 Tax=Nonomuraea roseoviolacea TaxID=103837 RepID=UPI0031E27D8A
MTQERNGAGPAPEDESDALLDALGRGEPPPHDDPAARLLAALRADACRDSGIDDGMGHDAGDGTSRRAWEDGITRAEGGGVTPVVSGVPRCR